MITSYKSIQSIKRQVDSNRGIMTDKLGSVVKASSHGLTRSTPGNVKIVREELAGENLELICNIDSPDQNTLVRIYDRDSPVASIIDALQTPSSKNDGILRNAALTNKEENLRNAELIEQIAELIEQIRDLLGG